MKCLSKITLQKEVFEEFMHDRLNINWKQNKMSIKSMLPHSLKNAFAIFSEQ